MTDQTTNRNATYALWMHAIDRYLLRVAGISIHDLSDFLSRDLYDAGYTAQEAAQFALEDDDLGHLFLDDMSDYD